MTPEEEDDIRRRQKSRAIVTAIALAGMVLLFYLITLVRIGTAG